MRLARLRHQMLIAMGLPACWTQSAAPTKAPPEPREPPAVYRPPERQPEIAMFDAKSCTIDSIVETVCGRMTTEYCEANAQRLDVANGVEGLYVTTFDEAKAVLESFILDDKKSETYVVRLQALNEKLDGKPACCYSRCTTLATGVAKPIPSPLPYGTMRTEACIPEPLKGTALPDQNSPECPQGVKLTGELRPFSATRNDMCCYTTLTKRSTVIRGRPARVDGDPRFAELASNTAWHAATSIDASAIAAATRARLAASWLEVARMEHASIAAFSTTSLRLLSFGAPPELIAQAHRAALDEIEHARIAFALASAYAMTPIAPAQFDDAARVTPMTLREFAIETFVDGCVGETSAAVEAARAADVATDPALVDVLRQMADDESRHAELAWAIVAWCVRQEPSILAELRVADPIIDGDHDLEPHGVLGARAKQQIHLEVMRDIVTPCLEALAA